MAQITLSLVLLASAGLFVRSLHNARFLDTGFGPIACCWRRSILFSAGYDKPRGTLALARVPSTASGRCPASSPRPSRVVSHSGSRPVTAPRRSNQKGMCRRRTSPPGRISIGSAGLLPHHGHSCRRRP